MTARPLVLMFCLLSATGYGQDGAILDVTSERARQQLENIQTLRDAGELQQAEAATLLLLERSRSQHSPADVAAAFHELGHISSQQNKYDLAQRAFQNSLEIFTEQELLQQIAVLLADLGANISIQSRYSDALDYLYRALTLYQSLNDQQGIAKLQLRIGIVLKELGQFGPALESLQRALSADAQNQDQALVGDALTEIGKIYLAMGQHEDALSYLQDALAINTKLALEQRIAKSHSVLGELYLNMQHYDQARIQLNEAITRFSALDAPLDHDWALTTLGQVELAQGNTQLGLTYLTEALGRAKEHNFASLLTHIHLAIAEAFLRLNNLELALNHADKGLIEAEKRDELSRQTEFLAVKVSVFTAQQNFRQAFEALARKTRLEALIVDKNSAMSMAQLQSELEVERQAKSIDALRRNKAIALAEAEQKNLRTTLFLGSIVAILLFIFLLWSRFTQRHQNIVLKREVKYRTQELEEKNRQLQDAYQTLEQVSLRDPLTGLYNRHYLEAQLPGEIQRCQHSFVQTAHTHAQDQDLLCFVLDIDNFKRINDDYGHLAGDRFLMQFTKVIRDVFRQTDLLIRWGGEEFLVICRNANRYDMCMLAERFRAAVTEETFYLTDELSIKGSCSIGFCSLPLYRHHPYKLDWQRTFSIMDYCLYAAKNSGKNCWVGVIEGLMEQQGSTRATHHIEQKFALPHLEIATSLNNLASINWPDENANNENQAPVLTSSS
ncbi:diguanylate cyclase [Alteromonas aestuariivivens]|nr:diguanylate cyclase [Alteromonas aestuariivivens]